QIMNGLLDGLKSGWETVKGWVGNVGGWIRNLKGPLDYDRTLLIPAGDAIMDGLLRGLRAGWQAVEQVAATRGVDIAANFEPRTLAVAPAVGAAGGMGAATVINVRADRFTDGTRVGREIDGELRRLRGRSG